jgi:hypothetical protein
MAQDMSLQKDFLTELQNAQEYYTKRKKMSLILKQIKQKNDLLEKLQQQLDDISSTSNVKVRLFETKRLLRSVPNLAKTSQSVITSRRRSNSEGFGEANLLLRSITSLTLPQSDIQQEVNL